VFLSKKVSEENKILGYVSQGAFLSIPSPNPYTMLQLPHVGKKGQEEGKADSRFMAVLIRRIKVGVNTVVKATFPFS
jgi:hypothetical protein